MSDKNKQNENELENIVNVLTPKGIALTILFEASSLNYGEGLGNMSVLKKITRGDGKVYTYFARQAIARNIKVAMNIDNAPLKMDKSVIQFAPEATIDKYPEVDLFGYFKTEKPLSIARSAITRITNAVSLEPYEADMDFLTNKGFYDRYNRVASEDNKAKGGNISQNEIHKSYYTYTVTIELDKVGIDENYNMAISAKEKADRVIDLLKAIKMLNREIKGRNETLSPLFVIGGVYNRKNPWFENKIKVDKNSIKISPILSTLALDKEVKDNTMVGLISGIFDNDVELKEKLDTIEVGEFFDNLEEQVKSYYLE